MANVLPEVRPSVESMPHEGFVMQTGGSARRTFIKNDGNDTYHVHGVPGHTHNASAMISVTADYSATRDVALTIHETWAEEKFNTGVDDFTDSVEPDDAGQLYDRAIERGIGEIAIIPENCHQEIREPVRDIYELRTLVTPKDKLDTLTYVEEVGGFVDQVTGEVPDPEPLYPDVQVDILFDYDDPVDPVVPWVNGNNNAAGTGNRTGVGIATEFRFEGDWSTDIFSRDANGQGNGTSFAVLERAACRSPRLTGSTGTGPSRCNGTRTSGTTSAPPSRSSSTASGRWRTPLPTALKRPKSTRNSRCSSPRSTHSRARMGNACSRRATGR